MRAASDQSGDFAQLFDLAEQSAGGKLPPPAVRQAVAKSLRSMGVPVPD
jgi:hypothetical protein